MRTLSAGQISIVTGTLALAGTMWTGTSADGSTLANRLLAAVSAARSAQAAGSDPQSDGGAPGTQAVVANPAAEEDSKAGNAYKNFYGVINLTSLAGFGFAVNARGQAAFDYLSLEGDRMQVGFFDGERTIDISPPHTQVAMFSGLNDKGEVALIARLERAGSTETTALLPFRWSPGRGLQPLRPLNPEVNTLVSGINKHGDIVGGSRTAPGDGTYQSVRWTAANRLLPLPRPTGVNETFATDINDSAVSTGYGTVAGGGAQVLVWDAAGRPSRLGSFGARTATASRITKYGELGGMLDVNDPTVSAFLWSPGKRLARAGTGTVLHALNDAGELVGRRIMPDSATHAFVFSRTRGLLDLHPRSFRSSEAAAVNGSGVIVGEARNNAGELYAYRWSRTGMPTDLNTLLHDQPKGLTVTRALAISDNGDIVADSNAGLLLLRPGNRGTDAPVLGSLEFSSLQVGELSRLSVSFRDRNLNDTHTATVDWGDGRGPQPAVVRQFRGRGEVQSQYRFPRWGGYRVIVRVTDSSRRTTKLGALVSADDPGGPGLVGSGTLGASTAEGSLPAPTLFQLAAPLALQGGNAAPFTFRLLGHTSFKGEQLDRVSVEGKRVRLEGRGTLEGRPGYRFTIDATAGDGAASASRMAVRITENDAQGGMRLAFAAGEAAAQGGQTAPAAELRQGSLRLVQAAAGQR